MDMKLQAIKRKPEYKWIIVALCFLMVFTCLGFCSSNKSLYLSVITEALGIKRSVFSFSDSCRYITTAVVNLFFGTLVSKYGTRKLIGAGFLCLISWTSTTMVGCVVGRWCKENKGTIMGAVLCANGFGGALAAQIVSPIIYEEGNPFGYRNSYYLVAGILLVVGILVVTLFKEKPAEYVEEEAPAKKKASRGMSWSGVEFKEVVRRPYFYLAAGCIFLTGLMLQGTSGVSAAPVCAECRG